MKSKKIKNFILTVDGKSGSGKSTAAKLLSKKYKIPLLSSGQLYRWAAKKLIERKQKNEIVFLKKSFKKLNYNNLKKLNLHTPEISYHSAIIAKRLKIRMIIKKYQKEFVKKNKNYCVIEGRDSHIIFSDAFLKFFLKSNLSTAAVRRYSDLKKKKIGISLKQVKNDLKKRDYSDITRKHSPLILAKDHVVIRSDILNKSQMINKMSKKIENKIKNKYGIGYRVGK